MFESDFDAFVSLVVVQNAILCFSSKTSSKVLSWVARDLELPTKFAWGKLKITFSYRNSRYCLVSISQLTSSHKMVFRQKLIFLRSHRNFRDCLPPNSRLIASLESICALVAHFATNSLLPNPQKTHVFNFYVANVTFFQNS